ncbi:MAG: hypothetical protein LBH32_09160 [Dysgonamonadaceae bacterium]|jgi:hypothetical protein|nr:hypothetical protein [Dysgonamonadaceae bacterium]
MDSAGVTNRQHLYQEIDTMNYTDKLYLLSYITDGLIRTDAKRTHNLAELKGLGKGAWTDIDGYIQKERESWEY